MFYFPNIYFDQILSGPSASTLTQPFFRSQTYSWMILQIYSRMTPSTLPRIYFLLSQLEY